MVLLNPYPAEARNGWVTVGSYTGTNGQSVYVYVKPVDRSGSVRSFQDWNTESGREFTAKAMCDTWSVHLYGETIPAIPGSVNDNIMKIICR